MRKEIDMNKWVNKSSHEWMKSGWNKEKCLGKEEKLKWKYWKIYQHNGWVKGMVSKLCERYMKKGSIPQGNAIPFGGGQLNINEFFSQP